MIGLSVYDGILANDENIVVLFGQNNENIKDHKIRCFGDYEGKALYMY